jgi:hypothetical protein
LLHNRPVEYLLRFVRNYTDHFSGNFLFINGDAIERNKIPETGQFHITDVPFLVIGLYVLIKSKNSFLKLIWFLFLISPVASAITFQTPHAIRSHALLIPIILVNSVGAWTILRKFRLVSIVLLLFISYWNISRFLHEYYVHYPSVYPAAWEYGFSKLVDFVKSKQGNYEKVIVTDTYDQPYILFLFYLKYPPKQFQNSHTLSLRDKFNFSTVRSFDKYLFQDASWEKVSDTHSSLIVASPNDIPEVGVNIIETINFPNGSPAFKIISN